MKTDRNTDRPSVGKKEELCCWTNHGQSNNQPPIRRNRQLNPPWMLTVDVSKSCPFPTHCMAPDLVRKSLRSSQFAPRHLSTHTTHTLCTTTNGTCKHFCTTPVLNHKSYKRRTIPSSRCWGCCIPVRDFLSAHRIALPEWPGVPGPPRWWCDLVNLN